MRLDLPVANADAGERLDRFLAQSCPEMSRSALAREVTAGRCTVDGSSCAQPSLRLKAGQQVTLDIAEAGDDLLPEDGPTEVLWEDGRLLVCAKAAGLTVHPCPSCPSGTLVQRLLARYPRLAEMPGQRPGIVHRLDKDTSGLLIVALDQECSLRLAQSFARRQVDKEYLALVHGRPADEGACREPVGRHPNLRTRMAVVPPSHGGRSACTRWSRLWSSPDDGASLLRVAIATGRTHQIRVHMAHLGHPLLGDATYAPSPVKEMAPRHMLHALRLTFPHPFTGERLTFSCPPPEDFLQSALATCREGLAVVIVGGPGTGKSSLLGHLAGRGLPTFSADACVAELYGPGGEAGAWMRGRLGEALLRPDGAVDRKALFAAMSSQPLVRRDVETVIHGMVRDAADRFFRESLPGTVGIAIAEIPLYLECGWRISPPPVVVGVRCPDEAAQRRLQESRGWDREKTATLAGWQWPAVRKEAACDVIVDNGGDPVQLAAEADRLLARLRSLADERRRAHAATLANLCRP